MVAQLALLLAAVAAAVAETSQVHRLASHSQDAGTSSRSRGNAIGRISAAAAFFFAAAPRGDVAEGALGPCSWGSCSPSYRDRCCRCYCCRYHYRLRRPRPVAAVVFFQEAA